MGARTPPPIDGSCRAGHIDGVIQQRVTDLLQRMAPSAQYTTQGRTVFVDLEHRTVQAAYLPRFVLETFLEGRGANMFLLYNLVDPGSTPLDPGTHLIFGSGVLTGIDVGGDDLPRGRVG